MNHRLVTFGLFLVPLGCAEPETYSETRDASTFTSPVDQLGCIKYGVDVEVSGLLARVPPEDASTSPETGSRNDLTLRLPRTACAAPLPLDGYLPAISGVQDILLAVTSMDRDSLESAVGKRVKLRGIALPVRGRGADSVIVMRVAMWAVESGG